MPQVSFFFLQNKRWERHIQMTMHFYRVFGHNMTHITINKSEHSYRNPEQDEVPCTTCRISLIQDGLLPKHQNPTPSLRKLL